MIKTKQKKPSKSVMQRSWDLSHCNEDESVDKSDIWSENCLGKTFPGCKSEINYIAIYS